MRSVLAGICRIPAQAGLADTPVFETADNV
jgi:hypothetical protein